MMNGHTKSNGQGGLYEAISTPVHTSECFDKIESFSWKKICCCCCYCGHQNEVEAGVKEAEKAPLIFENGDILQNGKAVTTQRGHYGTNPGANDLNSHRNPHKMYKKPPPEHESSSSSMLSTVEELTSSSSSSSSESDVNEISMSYSISSHGSSALSSLLNFGRRYNRDTTPSSQSSRSNVSQGE